MPRNPNGSYTLPAGNPVVSGTIIDTDWANPTLADIANEITNSLSRTGEGGMLVPLKFADGSKAIPGISWINENRTGFYRAGTNDMRCTVNGVDSLRWDANGVWVWNVSTQLFEKIEGGLQSALETSFDSTLYANVQTGLTAALTALGTTYESTAYNNVSVALDAALTAVGTFYNNTTSGLTSTNVKGALDELSAQIDALTGQFTFQGTWDAASNIPDLLVIVKESGDYWVCDVAGTTDLGLDPVGNPLNSWIVGDKAIYVEVTSPTPFTGFVKVAGTGDGTLAVQVIFDPLNFTISFPLAIPPENVQDALDFGWPLLAKVDAGYTASEIAFVNGATDLFATDVQAAIEEVNTKASASAPVQTVFGRIGDIVALPNDYEAVEVFYDPQVLPNPITDAVQCQGAIDDMSEAIAFLAGAVTLRGGWDALANDPDIGNVVYPKVSGNYWMVTVSGTSPLPNYPDGLAPITDWLVYDRALYVDNVDGTGFYRLRPDTSGDFLPLVGGTMLGQIVGIPPVAAGDLTRKDYVDGNFLPLSGGTLTGQLIVEGSDAAIAVKSNSGDIVYQRFINAASSNIGYIGSVDSLELRLLAESSRNLGLYSTAAINLNAPTTTINGKAVIHTDSNGLSLRPVGASSPSFIQFQNSASTSQATIGFNVDTAGQFVVENKSAGDLRLLTTIGSIELNTPAAINLYAPTTNVNGTANVKTVTAESAVIAFFKDGGEKAFVGCAAGSLDLKVESLTNSIFIKSPNTVNIEGTGFVSTAPTSIQNSLNTNTPLASKSGIDIFKDSGFSAFIGVVENEQTTLRLNADLGDINLTTPTSIELNAPVVNVNGVPIGASSKAGATISLLPSSSAVVTFATPFPNANFAVSVGAVTNTLATSPTFSGKTAAGFTVYNQDNAKSLVIDWIATPYAS